MSPIKPLKIPATEMEQHGKKMYVFVADGATIFDICTVSRREGNKETGYQRNLREGRAKSIANYIDVQKGLIPNNLIVNFQTGVSYEAGNLVIPRKADIGWIVDGQHRLFGMHLAQKNLQVCVVAFIGLSLAEQVALFIKINSTQKGVPSSLVLDLLGMMPDEESLERKCRDLVQQLNSEDDSPWYNNINMTGEGQGAISLVNFVRKLKPLVEPEKGVLRAYTFEEQYKIMFNYFAGIKSVFMEQWNDNRKNLTKTVGFGGLMNAFPEVFSLTREKQSKFTVGAVVEVFRLVKDLQFDSGTLGAGTGSKAEINAGKLIVDKLMTKVRETQPDTGLIVLDD